MRPSPCVRSWHEFFLVSKLQCRTGLSNGHHLAELTKETHEELSDIQSCVTEAAQTSSECRLN